jgi:hypothetical protein
MPSHRSPRPQAKPHPANERRCSNERQGSFLAKSEAIARRWTALGFDTLWLAERRFRLEGYEHIPDDLMPAVHFAHVTKT